MTVKLSVGGGGGDAGGGCALRASRGLAAPSGGVQIERPRRGALGSQPALEAQGVLYGVGEAEGDGSSMSCGCSPARTRDTWLLVSYIHFCTTRRSHGECRDSEVL